MLDVTDRLFVVCAKLLCVVKSCPADPLRIPVCVLASAIFDWLFFVSACLVLREDSTVGLLSSIMSSVFFFFFFFVVVVVVVEE